MNKPSRQMQRAARRALNKQNKIDRRVRRAVARLTGQPLPQFFEHDDIVRELHFDKRGNKT